MGVPEKTWDGRNHPGGVFDGLGAKLQPEEVAGVAENRLGGPRHKAHNLLAQE